MKPGYFECSSVPPFDRCVNHDTDSIVGDEPSPVVFRVNDFEREHDRGQYCTEEGRFEAELRRD